MLAEKLEMHWQQLQRYAQSDYASANLQVVQRVAAALLGNAEDMRQGKQVSVRKKMHAKRAKA